MNDYLAKIKEFGTIDAESDALLADCFQVHPVFQMAVDPVDRHFLILGRKGAGKTAIYKEIVGLGESEPDVFSVGYAKEDYPWHYHNKMVTPSAAEQERYIHSWRYYILISLAKILLRQDNSQPWSEEAREAYGKLKSFVEDTYGSINPHMTEIFSPDKPMRHLNKFGIDIGAKVDVEMKTQDLPSLFHEVNRSLEALIMKSLNPDNRYYVCFDELDQGFMDSPEQQKQILTGLILAARKFAFAAKEHTRLLKVLVFLRSDIYRNSLSFDDQNKVTDTYSLEIEWDRTGRDTLLKSLMERRFAELLQIAPDGAWEKLFDETEEMGRFPTKYDFILAHTFCRPRDVIKFCNCVLNAWQDRRQRANGDPPFTRDIIYDARDDYGEYFRKEITDEIKNYYADHQIHFEILQQIGFQVFNQEQFRSAYDGWSDRLTESRRPEEILEALYNFSIIGFARPPVVDPNGANYHYWYKDTGARFNRSADWFCTHWGLVRSLKLRRYQFDQGGNGKPEAMGRGKIQSTFQQIDGSLNCFALVDPSNPVPVATLPVNTAWIVRMEWEVHGPLVSLLTGNWNINVYLESLGGGFEGSVGSVIVPVESGLLFSGPQRTYQIDIPVPSGTPPAGVYKLVTTITHQVREGEPSGIAGFQEGAILQFFSL
ncbi:MAG: P-loop ATPase, Sll1717 family [Blastocatellia bacterium]